LISRVRKLSASALATVFCCIAACPFASFGACAAFLQEVCGIQVTRQALFQRMTPKLVTFMEHILARVLTRLASCGGNVADTFPVFNRILVQDSTIVSLPEKLRSLFPGSSNQHGKTTPQVRIQACIDLMSEACVHL
jgi:hypothetical protein